MLACLLCCGCTREPLPQIVYVQCESGSTLSNKIDFAIFEGFKPGMTFHEARAQFGEPARIWQGSNQTIFHQYAGTDANIAVAKETQVSGDMPTVEWWTVYAFPSAEGRAFSLPDILSPDVCAELESRTPPYQLVIRDNPHDEGAWCNISSDGITEIRWMNADSRHAAHSKTPAAIIIGEKE